MKKYFLIGVAACLCLAMAAPALAEVKMSGVLTTDIYWRAQEAQLLEGGRQQGAAATREDLTTFHINSDRPQNYLQATYTNKDNTVGGRFRIRIGLTSNNIAPAGTDGPEFQTSHLWWKFYPGAKVSVGSVKQVIGGAGGLNALVGTDAVTIVMIGYGNLHTSYRQGILLEWAFNKMVGLDVGLYRPANYNAGATIPGLDKAGNAFNAPVEIKVPRIDIGVPIKWAGLKINPCGSWVTRKYSQVAPNSVDSYDVWAAGVDVTYSYGPLYLAGEYKVGENLADANYSGGVLGGLAYVNANGVTEVSDAEHDYWFISARYAITKKFRVRGSYGSTKVKRPGNPNITGDDQDIDRKGYGIAAEWFLAPNLVMMPEIYVQDAGDSNIINGVVTESGKQTIYGLLFQLLF
jgi:predicted porin